MGPGQYFVARVRSGLGLGLENFPLKSQIFNFFALRLKKIFSCWDKKYTGQRRVGLLFTLLFNEHMKTLGIMIQNDLSW